MSDALRDSLQDALREQGVDGVVTHYVLVVSVHVADSEQIINIGSDGMGIAMHLGLAKAAMLTAEQRLMEGEREDE